MKLNRRHVVYNSDFQIDSNAVINQEKGIAQTQKFSIIIWFIYNIRHKFKLYQHFIVARLYFTLFHFLSLSYLFYVYPITFTNQNILF